MPEPLTAADPARIGPYTVESRLGSGGMGAVYLGHGPDGRTCAIKVVHPGFAREREFRTRFGREVAAARRVTGPHLARVLDADPDAPQPWLAIEYVDGPSLDDAVTRRGPLPDTDVRTMARELFGALATVHAERVVHRDVKPTNVLLGPSGAVLIDFGIAHAAESTRITRTGMVIGSPGFMSPEQASGDAIGPASDVFSLAAVLLFAATGTGPFGVGSPAALLLRAADTAPRLDGLPGTLRPLLGPCLARDPAARPTAAALARELAGVDRVLPASPRSAPEPEGHPDGPEPPDPARRWWWLIASGATAVAAALVITTVVLLSNAAPPAPVPPPAPVNVRPAALTLPDDVRDVAYSPDGRRAFVAHGDGVGVVDTTTNSVTTSVRTASGASAVAVTPDGGRLYVGLQNGYVQILDAATFRAIGQVQVLAYTSRLVIAPDGQRVVALTASNSGPASLTVVDTATSRVVRTVPTGLTAPRLEPSGDGSTLFLVDSGVVVALGASDMSVRSRTPVDSPLPRIASAPGDEVYLSGGRGPFVRRLGSDGRIRGLPVPDELAGLSAMAGTPDGRYLHVLRNEGTGGTQRFEATDTADARVTATGLVSGITSQATLRASPDGHQLYVVGFIDPTVHVLTVPG